MKTCNTCNTTKPLSSFGPHSTTADGHNPKCKDCVSEYNREYRRKNKAKIDRYQSEYAEAHRETARERTQQWRADNPERTQQNNKRYYQQNRDRELESSKQRYQNNKEQSKERAREWRKDNPDRVAANLAARRAAKKQATPIWADLTAIQAFYTNARALTESTGVEYQVDHIVPLTSDVVCGLHCEHNLQVITAEENNSKNNKLIEELLVTPC